MPANGPVKIIWQIIFTFIPILDLWAFYRIKKLRRYFLFVVIPVLVIMIVMIVGAIVSTLDSSTFDDPTYDPFMSEDPTMIAIGIVGQITGIGFHILAIYLVYTWSKQWNKQFQTSESDF
jgi:hypothetical protein